MQSSFFSIIIPTYNSEKTIVSCLNSICQQTFKRYEILIMDGLSTDNTINIVKDLNDDNIFIYSESDKGIYDAMNKGILKAKGKWLLFLGSDDKLYDKNVLGSVFLFLKTTHSKVVYGNTLVKGNTKWASDNEVYGGKFDLKKLITANIPHQAIFYNALVFNKIDKYNVEYNICADYDLNLKLWARRKFEYIDIIVAIFKSGGLSSNENGDIAFANDFFENISHYFKWQLYKMPFRKYEITIMQQAKKNLSSINILFGLYLLCVGCYFKINRKINPF